MRNGLDWVGLKKHTVWFGLGSSSIFFDGFGLDPGRVVLWAGLALI